jgi:uncharacterized protein (DUF488 family)
MSISGDLQQRRVANADALAALGIQEYALQPGRAGIRMLRQGGGFTVYTVGYERRDGEELIAILQDQGIVALADVRQHPISRKADFRAAALAARCREAGIEYQAWPCLGSTVQQRRQLESSGDFQAFAKRFRSHAQRTMREHLQRLADCMRTKPTALLCYERRHEDCHRSVIADLLADRFDAAIVAM